MLPLTRREMIKMFVDMVFGRNQDKIPFPNKTDGIEAIVRKIELQDKEHKPQYSNFGFAVIGHILGIVSGIGYHDAMKEFVLNELNLPDTYSGTDNRNLHGYSAKNKDCGNWNLDGHYMLPCGGLSSTADDLLTYAKINMHEDKPYLSLCHMKHADFTKDFDMGLGWWLQKNDNSIIQHEGGTGAFSSILVFDKKAKSAVVVLANYRLAMPSEKPIALAVLENL
jgi:CubicO group peptidase (beta-lactamase class C family)